MSLAIHTASCFIHGASNAILITWFNFATQYIHKLCYNLLFAFLQLAASMLYTSMLPNLKHGHFERFIQITAVFSALQPYNQPYNQYWITIMPLLSWKTHYLHHNKLNSLYFFFPPILAGVSASKPVLTLDLPPTFPRKWQKIVLIQCDIGVNRPVSSS